MMIHMVEPTKTIHHRHLVEAVVVVEVYRHYFAVVVDVD
jgi:hypothetical protein